MNLDEFNNLSAEEREIALKILKEYEETGKSKALDDLLYQDYKEIPVDIMTFISDDRYLGKAWKNSKGELFMYPFWQERLKELFPTNTTTSVNNIIESGARGLGKAQPLYSKILTSNGFVNMGDIKLGDLVFGDDGKTHAVSGIFPQGKKKVYEVTFNDGSKTRCSDEHLWNVRKQTGHNKSYKTLTLNEILQDGYIKVDSRGYNVSKYSIPITSPLELTHINTFIDPYVMGCLIGDGGLSRNYIKFTSKDDEIVNTLNESLNINGYKLSRLSDSYGYGLKRIDHKRESNKYSDEIKSLGLNCTSEYKFVPDCYKFNDIEARLSVLQGLMDTDGSCAVDGYCTFTTVSKQLADDVVFIVQSLGGTAPLRIRRDRGYINNEGIKIKCKDAYEISINLPSELCPFRLNRKRERINPNKHNPARVIRNIEYIGEEECQCIMLDSESHLYLTDDLIVTHNTEIMVTIGLYLMYRVMCLRDAHTFYNLKPTEQIAFAFMNITKYLAEDIGITKFQSTVQSSPWFMERGTITGINTKTWNPPDFIQIIVGSQSSHVIGQPIYFAGFDEIDFIKNQDIDRQKQLAMDMIDTAIGGMKTRFIHKGKNPTVLVLASSKRSDKSFLEEHMKKKLSDEGESKNTLIVDEAVWNVKPPETYSGKKFKVALGNKFLASEVLKEDADIDALRNRGYKIIDVPVEFRSEFLDDIDRALCDYAGIAASDLTKYISGVRLAAVKIPAIRNPFVKEIIEVGNAVDDTTQYYDFFDITAVDPKLKSRPLYIHLDMSISGDKTGIAGTWIVGKKPSIEDGPKELYYQMAFGVSVKAPKGHQVSFAKNKNFIYWLKEQGFRIKLVTTDTFQNASFGQDLVARGFEYEILSVDRVSQVDKICAPYAFLKSAIYDQRILLPGQCDFLTEELLGLERNGNTGRIDHPDGGKYGCFTGDTKVSLVDGLELSFLELVKEFNSGKINYVYSFNESSKIIEPKPILKAWKTRENAELVEVVLDNGEVIRCTPNHRFMLRDGSYLEAEYLSEGDSLMPLYRKYPSQGGLKNYRMYYEPLEDKWHYEHRGFAKEVLDERYLVHHKDCNPRNNSPNNMEIHVVSVRRLDSLEDVYDLEIADNHNFALSSGVFVHNSKDMADALAGSLYDASQHAEEYAFEFGDDLDYFMDVSNQDLIIDPIQQYQTDFEGLLIDTFHAFENDTAREIKKQDDEIRFKDFGLGPAKPFSRGMYLANQGIFV